MKDYEVNYVHQESKTIPDANYTFETSTNPAPNKCSDFIKSQTPPTVKDVLLKTWAQDTRKMASLMLFHDPLTGQIGACGMDGMIFAWFEWIKDALAAQVAYLNSAAEVGK